MTRFWNFLRVASWVVASLLLATPYMAMQLSVGDVAWTASDFVIMGVILYGCCALFEVGMRLSAHSAYRFAIGLAIATAFFTTWINLAVGIIGSENQWVNLVFFGVLAVGFVGVLLSRFEARGMALAMVVTATAQAAIIAVALYYRSLEAVVLSGFFAACWAVCARLFANVARQERLAA